MVTTTVREARLNLSRLLELVERGEEVLIRNRRRPVAKLVSAAPLREAAFPDLRAFRMRLSRKMKRRVPGTDATVRAEREERG